jgi:hypothetical protein
LLSKLWGQRAQFVDQFNMRVLGQIALAAFDNGEDQRQSAAFIDQTYHQTNTTAADKTAVNGQDHFFKVQIDQHALNKWQKVGLLGNLFIDNNRYWTL